MLFESLLPAGKELLDAEDLISIGLFKNLAQVGKAVENGLPGLRLGFRSIKFHRKSLLEWLESRQTTAKPKKPHKHSHETEQSYEAAV